MIITEVDFSPRGAGIVTYSRDHNNELVKKRHRFRHYFYVPSEEGTHTTLFGNKVKKHYPDKFWTVKDEIKWFEETFEADIQYTRRFMIDKGEEFNLEGEPRVMFFDIETTGFSREEDQIISIVAYDNYEEKYYDFIWADDLPMKSEKEMLEAFMDVIRDVDPDIITGWNSDRFDVPFVYDRLVFNNIKTSKASRMGQDIYVYDSNQGKQYRIKGRINIDYLKAYKKMQYGELDSYALDFVALKELGVGKLDIESLPKEIWERRDYDELLRYNRRDVEIMAQLDKKLGIFKFLDTLSRISSVDFQDVLFNSRIVDSYVLRYTSVQGIVLPTKSYNQRRSNYRGAKVLDPRKGIHDNVGIFDLASLYPSIIISFNLSPETMSRENRAREAKGLIPTLLEDLFVLRQEYRSKGLDNEQRVVKEIMNSFYGVMAFPSFRLFKQEMAAAITKHGREIIEHTKTVVEDTGYTVIYGDTDSVFVSGIPNTNDANKLESAINKRYNDYASNHNLDSHRLRIEFEAFAPRALLVKKKRYAMKLDDGTYKIAGFQMKRSDTQPLAKELQEKILHMILEGASVRDVQSYYKNIRDEVYQKMHIEKIGIPRKFTKDLDEYNGGYAIEGAIYANQHFSKNFGAGDKVVSYHIKYVLGHEPTQSLCLEYGDPIPRGFTVDIKKHWDRIDKAITPLLEDVGLASIDVQTTLF
jgi:DNA polymerase I